MYDVGELSMMMVSRMSRPIWERSYALVSYREFRYIKEKTDLDVVPLVIVAAVPKQSVVDNIMDVQLIQQRITVLETWLAPIYPKTASMSNQTHFRDRCSKDHHFVQFPDTFHELIDSGSLDHVNIVVLAFDLYRNSEIRTFENLL